jgi:hypothetical protein
VQVSRADEVVVVGSVAGGLLGRAVLDHGSSKAIQGLLADQGDEIYRIPLPSVWVGKRFREGLQLAKDELNAILIGVEPVDGELRVNPPIDYVFAEGEMIAVIAEDRPKPKSG